MLLEELRELLVHGALDLALHFGVPEAGLRLALELRLEDLHGEDRGESLPHILAGEALLVPLEERPLASVVVEGAGERGP